jgi:hypothetical protein
MPTMVMKVKASGPMFTPKAKSLTYSAVENGIKALLEMGEERLDKQLRPRPTRFPGYGQFRETQTMLQKESKKTYDREMRRLTQRLNR